MATNERRAIFLDRDGTIIHDVGYPRDPKQVKLLPGVVEALLRLQKDGWLFVLVSNQSGIGRRMVTAEEAERVHKEVVAQLAAHGIELAAAHYCPHAPEENCTCRKPSPEMLLRAANSLNIDLQRSYMIGDKISDVEAGKQAGCRTILILRNQEQTASAITPDAIVTDWSQIIQHIQM